MFTILASVSQKLTLYLIVQIYYVYLSISEPADFLVPWLYKQVPETKNMLTDLYVAFRSKPFKSFNLGDTSDSSFSLVS